MVLLLDVAWLSVDTAGSKNVDQSCDDLQEH
jgi:hypothetical protein